MISKSFKGALHSYSFRIALLYVLFFLVSTLILFGFIYYNGTRSATEQLDETLRSDKIALAERYLQSDLNGLIRLVNARVQGQGQDSIYSLISDDQEIVAGNLASWPAQLLPQGLVEFEITSPSDGSKRTVFRGEVIKLPEGYLLLLARSRQGIINAQHGLINTFTWATMITLMLGLIGGYLLSNRAVRRISSINRLCRAIVEGDISQRLKVAPQVQDDLDDLTVNINSMLDKIEGLMGDIIQVSDNIAHDMRTPLSKLRLKLESIEGDLAPDSPVILPLGDSINDTDAIIDTFNALLRISKLQAGNKSAQFDMLNLTTLLEDVLELYTPLAEEKQQSVCLRAREQVNLLGDRDLLFQAIANLLDNAIKYTPLKGEISLLLKSQETGGYCVSVCDNGPGVSKADMDKLCFRFFRADSSRSLPGNGLGLSLVEAIASLHKAKLVFVPNKPMGLCASINFPDHLH